MVEKSKNGSYTSPWSSKSSKVSIFVTMSTIRVVELSAKQGDSSKILGCISSNFLSKNLLFEHLIVNKSRNTLIGSYFLQKSAHKEMSLIYNQLLAIIHPKPSNY